MRWSTLSRAGAFWWLQGAGWSGYVAVKLLAFPMSGADALWVAGKGIVLTSMMRVALHGLARQHAPPAIQLTGVVTLALLASALSLALSQYVAHRGWLLTAPGAMDWLARMEGRLFEFLLFLAWTALYLGIRHAMDLRVQRVELAEALARAEQASARMLRYQLNPHFLFNALASLRALVVDDGERAGRVITHLSGFLRHSLVEGARDATSLASEFDAIGDYLAIQKVRFEDRLVYAIDLGPGLDDVSVPAFLVHPLVENAVKYGLHTCADATARIEVSAVRRGARCVVEIRNSGRWLSPAEGSTSGLLRSGIGLDNVRARLEGDPGRSHTLSVGPAEGGVLARLELELA